MYFFCQTLYLNKKSLVINIVFLNYDVKAKEDSLSVSLAASKSLILFSCIC
jgi:hypothetical protein